MSIYDLPAASLDGEPDALSAQRGKAALVVNVASRCGLTPQYAGLVRLQDRFADRGFTVLGFPCNQFGAQEPGSPEEIATFCSTTYGVDFPLLEKVDVNGPGRHPVFEQLADVPDEAGRTGDVQWNFEKWVVDADGRPVARFSPTTDPESDEVLATIERVLPRTG